MEPAPLDEGGRGERLPHGWRITRTGEIRALFQRGKRSRTPHLDVFDSASPVAHPRVGVVVPRYKRRAVDRNRVKRRLRELLRRELVPWLSERGFTRDVLVRARREAYEASFRALREELTMWRDRRWSREPSSG